MNERQAGRKAEFSETLQNPLRKFWDTNSQLRLSGRAGQPSRSRINHTTDLFVQEARSRRKSSRDTRGSSIQGMGEKTLPGLAGPPVMATKGGSGGSEATQKPGIF